jgi:23S rRNA-/tRNA-specific pseudouridylate synthase
VTLPIRADPDPVNRPRQVVDPEHGKPARTLYKTLAYKEDSRLSRVALVPYTGASAARTGRPMI